MSTKLALDINLAPLQVNVNHTISVDRVLFALINSINHEVKKMATDVQAGLDKLTADVAQLTSVDQSAVALISGFAAQLAAAVAAAQSAGATAAQLQSFDDLSAGIEARTAELAAAVAAAPAA